MTLPGITPPYANVELTRQRICSEVAYSEHALVSAAMPAYENDTSGVPLDQRGIGQTLEVETYLLDDFIDHCEQLEQRLAASLP